MNATTSVKPLGLLAGLTLACWLACGLWPALLLALGIHDFPTAYLDSYAILAAVDAVRSGADPHQANPLDPLLRYHVYSDWWLALRWLGLTRDHNFLLGTAWVGAFALTAWVTLCPRRFAEVFWLSLLLISPPVLLAIKRANNDLVIFVLLAGCGLAVTATDRWRQLLGAACLALATGLKYYPATGVMAFLWMRPVRRMPAIFLAVLLAVSLALASVWTEMARSRFEVVSTVHTMGAPLWWRDVGWKDATSLLPGLMLTVATAFVFALGRITVGLTVRGAPQERMRAALGALVLLTCFLSGVNYAYRWIFILWPAVWLWRQAGESSLPSRQLWASRIGCALIGLCLWHDGLFCLVVNHLPPVELAWLDQAQMLFRLWTQPLDWMLMLLLAGWLLEGALATVKDWWSERYAS